VDDRSRIAVATNTHDAVIADAVADVLLLITELAENAVQHTPPLTDVTIRASRVGRGVAIEVEDRGPGFGEDQLERANALLEHPPEMSLAAGTGLGLLVTARLAARHGITVSLRNSPIGGTTAIVLIPHALLITGEVRDPIVGGGLLSTEGPTTPPASTLPDQPATPLPSVSLALPGPAEPDVPAPTAPTAANVAPWHWLTESPPARTSATGSPTAQVGEPQAGDQNVPAPLPRRIPPSAPGSDQNAPAAAASVSPDQAPATAAADRDSGNGPDASLADEP
jgi:hypothetical protein